MKIKEVVQKGRSALCGEVNKTLGIDHAYFRNQPIMKAFLEDQDLQEITVCSSNIGFVYTFTKVFEPESAKALGNKI